jgi:hypothetical protein
MASVALEQPGAELAFETGYLPAESRLGRMSGSCRPAETARFGHREEGFEEVQLHLYTIVILLVGDEKFSEITPPFSY